MRRDHSTREQGRFYRLPTDATICKRVKKRGERIGNAGKRHTQGAQLWCRMRTRCPRIRHTWAMIYGLWMTWGDFFTPRQSCSHSRRLTRLSVGREPASGTTQTSRCADAVQTCLASRLAGKRTLRITLLAGSTDENVQSHCSLVKQSRWFGISAEAIHCQESSGSLVGA